MGRSKPRELWCRTPVESSPPVAHLWTESRRGKRRPVRALIELAGCSRIIPKHSSPSRSRQCLGARVEDGPVRRRSAADRRKHGHGARPLRRPGRLRTVVVNIGARATAPRRPSFAGQVYINDWWVGGVERPFGGAKRSGYGREKGQEVLLGYVQTKNVGIRY